MGEQESLMIGNHRTFFRNLKSVIFSPCGNNDLIADGNLSALFTGYIPLSSAVPRCYAYNNDAAGPPQSVPLRSFTDGNSVKARGSSLVYVWRAPQLQLPAATYRHIAPEPRLLESAYS